MSQSRFMTATLMVFLAALLGGCASYQVGVSGFSDPFYAGGRTFWLLSGNKDVTADDLEFREYAGYLRRGLVQAGFSEAANFDKADLAIFVRYGIGDPKEHHFSYSLPIYGPIGGGTYTYSGTSYSSYSSATTHGTIYQQPQYGVVGSQQVSRTDVTHLRYLLVDALDVKAHRTDKKVVPVWQMEVFSRGSSADLRRVFPVLVVAATPHFGKNTKRRVVVDIMEDDKRLQQMREERNK